MEIFHLFALFAYAASVLASPMAKEIIAKRQVVTANLRNGSRRLTARQAHGSPTVGFMVSRYFTCPAELGSQSFAFLCPQTVYSIPTETTQISKVCPPNHLV